MTWLIRQTAFLCLIFILSACGSKSAQEHLAAAKDALASADTETAIIELKNALQKDNRSAESRWLLGKIYLDRGDTLSAGKELQRAYDLEWSYNEVTPALAEALLAQGLFAEVRSLATEQALDNRAQVQLLALQALAAMAMGEPDEATKQLDKALNINPQSPEALLAKAQLLAGRNELAEAQAILDPLLEQNPDNPKIWGLAGDIYNANQQPEQALSAYSQSLALHAGNFSVIFKRGLLALHLQDTEQAQQDASTLLKMSRTHPLSNYLQGLIDYQAQRYDQAITSLSAAEPIATNYPLTLFFLGSANFIQGHLDQAEIYAARFHNLIPHSNRGRKLLAIILLNQRQYGEVPDLLQPVLDANPDDTETLNLMASALLADGKSDEGIALLKRVAELHPDSPVAQVKLGAGLLMKGNYDNAAQPLKTALELDPDFQQADALLILNHVRHKDFDAAIKAAEEYRFRHITSPTPLTLLGQVYQAAGQTGEAAQAFTKALELDPGEPGANHGLAQLAAQRDDFALARKHYKNVLKHHKNHLPALIQLSLLDAKQQQWDAMESHLKQAIEAHPAALQPRLLLGRLYLGRSRPDKVSQVFLDLENEKKLAPAVLQLLALAQLATQDNSQAQFTLSQLDQAIPDSAPTHYLMAKAANGLGESEQAMSLLEDSLQLDPNHFPSRIALAQLKLKQQDLKAFEEHVNLLTQQAPAHPDVLTLRTSQALVHNDWKSALDLAKQAYAANPSPTLLGMFSAVKQLCGDCQEVSQWLSEWIEKHPDDMSARIELANTLQLEGHIEKAQVHYRAILQNSPNHLVALNNLAWNLREKEPQTALAYAKRASEISPDSADILDTLAVVEYHNEDYVAAESSIARALEIRPDNPSILYHQAMIALANGNNKVAGRVLAELARSDVDFPEKQKAEKLLQDIQ